MRKVIITALLMCGAGSMYAQKYMTRTGKVSFYSPTPLEKIEAFNNETAAIMDSKSGDVVFQVPVKSFKFDRALMEEHFNENYMESDKYPKAEYKGKVTDIAKVDFSKDGTYNVNTTGKLTIHNVTNDVTVPGTITIKGGKATINTKFNVKPKDYNITIPSVVEKKIAKEIEVTVNCILDKK
ncbi:MAG: YceI family protein [Bacteroidetes bacterium]|nr:YceI family protein [Bacteroidota bacterium]